MRQFKMCIRDRQMASGKSDEDKAGMLKSLLHVEDASKCGIDISEKIFLFESADGNLSLIHIS